MRGWSGGAKVLGKLPVPGRPTYLAYSRARAYCAFSRCGWGLFGHFFSPLSLLFSFSLSLGDGPILTEILSQRAVKPKTTNQPTNCLSNFGGGSHKEHACKLVGWLVVLGLKAL